MKICFLFKSVFDKKFLYTQPSTIYSFIFLKHFYFPVLNIVCNDVIILSKYFKETFSKNQYLLQTFSTDPDTELHK